MDGGSQGGTAHQPKRVPPSVALVQDTPGKSSTNPFPFSHPCWLPGAAKPEAGREGLILPALLMAAERAPKCSSPGPSSLPHPQGAERDPSPCGPWQWGRGVSPPPDPLCLWLSLNLSPTGLWLGDGNCQGGSGALGGGTGLADGGGSVPAPWPCALSS